MGHRHQFNASQSFENEDDQNWNHMHMEQHFVHLARAGSSDSSSFFYPPENMSVDGMHLTSHWGPAPRSTVYPSSSHNVEVAPYQPDAAGPSHDPFVHLSTAGTYSVPDSYAQHASPNYDRQTFHGVEGSFVDLPVASGRGPHKRKSPGIPSACERGSSSRYYNAGSSSDLPMASELRLEKPSIDSQLMPWERINMTPIHRGSGLSIRGEGSLRNVRSRPALDLESNLARTHVSGTPSHPSYSASHPIEHSSPVDLSIQGSSSLTQDWGHLSMSPAPGRAMVSDTSCFNHETNQFLLGSSASNPSAEIVGYHHDFVTSRNPVAPNFHANSTQSMRGVRSSFTQRSTSTFRASSSNLRLGHAEPSDEGLHLVAESYSSRHPRPLSTIGWRNGDRHGRSRISSERYRSLPGDAGLHDRFSSEGFMIVDRSALYNGSRNMFDQHREMRLDIDNMSYEELLALGERIGSVSTGLSEALISKCLTQTIYCSSDLTQDEGTCVICLEEYQDRDGVGTLKACGHDYHVCCIRKWLSMKNVCPVCKTSALADSMMDK